MRTITKKELIERVTTATGRKRSDVKAVLQCFLETVIAELGAGNRLELRDFGVFETRLRRPRVAQNPRTLKPVSVGPRRAVRFKGGRRLRRALDDAAATARVTLVEPPAAGSDGRAPTITVRQRAGGRGARTK